MKPILTILGLAMVIRALAAPSTEDTDRIYDGKRLSQWFAEFSQPPAYVTPATKAIQALGSNAGPRCGPICPEI
jgi:hypothetical protein